MNGWMDGRTAEVGTFISVDVCDGENDVYVMDKRSRRFRVQKCYRKSLEPVLYWFNNVIVMQFIHFSPI